MEIITLTLPVTDEMLEDMKCFEPLHDKIDLAFRWVALKMAGIEPDFERPDFGPADDNYCYECGRSCDCGE